MTTAAAAARPTGSPSMPKRDFLGEVKMSGQGLPNRVVLHGVEGVGKTSFGANAPRPIFLMARGETGLETLIDSGRVVQTPHFPETQSWGDVLGAVRSLIASEHEFKTLVIDTLNGIERLCHEEVCRRDFKGDWTDKGFMGFMRGYEVSLADWREFLSLLDQLRAERRMSILVLAHTKVGTFKNPEGPDFDRYQVDMHHKTWSLTHKWADMVLFANYFTLASKDDGGRIKGMGGQERVLYTERHASYDAKNRHGLPGEIAMGSSGNEAWGSFVAALRAGHVQQPTTQSEESAA